MIHEELHNRARLAVLGLKLSLGAHAGSVLIAAYGAHLFNQMISGREYSEDTLLFFDDLAGMLGLITIIIFIFTATTFVRWMLSAFDTLLERGMIMPFSRQYVAWAFFIPFINLARPYQVVSGLYEGAMQMAGVEKTTEKSYLIPWWLLYLVAGLIGNISLRLSLRSETLETVRNTFYMDIVSSAMLVGSAWLIIQIINSYSDIVTHAIENDRIDMIGEEDF